MLVHLGTPPEAACLLCVYPGHQLESCSNGNLQEFNRMLEHKMAASPVDGLIVYPEGMPVPSHAAAHAAFLPLCKP